MRSVTGPTVEQIVDVVVQLLAVERGEPEEDVHEQLEAAGEELPIDSLRLVEILTRIKQEFDVEVPANVASARSMRSVRAFAEVIQAACGGDRSPSS